MSTYRHHGSDRSYRRSPRRRSRSFSPDDSRSRSYNDYHQGDRFSRRFKEDSSSSSSYYNNNNNNNNMSSQQSSSSQDRRVYVGNLAYNVKWGELKDFMRQAGEVINADVLTLPNGKSKGCGIVEYATPQEAKRAIEVLSNQSINGRSIFVREDRESENKAPAARPSYGHDRRSHLASSSSVSSSSASSSEPTQVYVSNIPFSVTWKELKSLFQIAGAVLHADVFQSQGRSKGTGVVLFDTAADADNAIARLNGYEFNGRPLEVRLDRFYRPGARPGSRPYPPRSSDHHHHNNNNNNNNPSGNSLLPHHSSSSSPPSSSSSGFANYNGPVKRSPFTDGVSGNGQVNDTIFVSNLPWATTDQDLVELFQSVASVSRAEIQLEPSGRSAGSGVVQFDTPASAHIAIEKLNGYVYGNRPLVISFATYPDSTSSAATTAAGNGSSVVTPVATPSAPASVVSAPSTNGFAGEPVDTVIPDASPVATSAPES
ncbi:uncharacterized protein SAPINGB_P006243 [Magnusiomyces paraingens]|uniref:RRM domain-containing protein n=1 Tax=Magnusiomyces paraingens TaxID=2606893 RepID=A0A5E8CB25_9ASCO|nr:uncharacterized protein SAPINGB_P006243 [Saprochaete ingens]VVT58506.1 unnamed protein product [Saprochaete ingens]